MSTFCDVGRDGNRSAVGRALRVTGITVLGFGLVVLGIILMPLPGPGTLVVLAGLGVLGTEYAWARRAVGAIRRGAHLVHLRLLAKWRSWRTRGGDEAARLPQGRTTSAPQQAGA